MLSLVLPKGSLERATLELFDAADLTVRRSSDRDYHASIDDPRIDKVRFLRPQEIPSYLERGMFDLGITGRDWITETEADVVSLGELQYSKATSQPVRVVLAVPDSAPWQSVRDLPDGLRISTEFPELTRSLALAGTQLLLVPTNWPLVPRPEGERPPEVVIGMAAARVNRMAVACADRVGLERGQDWTGGTTIVVSYSSIRRGPCSESSGGTSARVRTRVSMGP